jgi:hypothetical protein
MQKILYGNVFSLKVNWNASKEYCEQRGMQLPTLKTTNKLQQVTEQLKQSGFLCKMKKI